jgi:hypothetical protein
MVANPLQGLAEIGAKAPALFIKEARAAERFWDFFKCSGCDESGASQNIRLRRPAL